MKTSAIALTLLLSQYTTVIVDGQLANAPIKRTRALSSTTDNAISSSKQQQRINTARLLKTKRRDNKARLLEDGSMSLATTDSMSMSVSLEPDVKDMFAAADSAEKGVESVGTFGSFEGILMPSSKTMDAKAEKMAKAEKHSKATKLFRRKLDAREEQQAPIKRRVSPADRFSSGRNLQEDGSMSLATETSMSFLIEPEVKDMFAAAGGDIEATTVESVQPQNGIFPKSSKVYKTKSSKAISSEKTVDAKAEKVADAKAEKVVGDAKSSKVYSEKTVDRRHRRRQL